MLSFKQFLESRSWEGFPFRKETGEAPHEGDTMPGRTPEGHFVFYHGTSNNRAKSILKSRNIKPDDLNTVGVSTTPEHASIYSTMKSVKDQDKKRTMGRIGRVLRVVVDKHWINKNTSARREIGGSGKNQFLLSKNKGTSDWEGIPPNAIHSIRTHKRG